jgi:AcrR family transcriptional regulator
MAKKNAAFERQGYHHGNLKEALIVAARQLIAERGVAGFTLIDAAKMAGVSAAAPYRHFTDRDALIQEVAQRGGAEFAKRLGIAWQTGGEPASAFALMGEAYLAFAREEPGYYAAMFSGTHKPPPAGDPAFGGLIAAIARVSESKGTAGDPRELAYQVWALSHGLATLSAAGQIPLDRALKPETLLRNGVLALMRGSSASGTPQKASSRV